MPAECEALVYENGVVTKKSAARAAA
jgi:hypothetical protein